MKVISRLKLISENDFQYFLAHHPDGGMRVGAESFVHPVKIYYTDNKNNDIAMTTGSGKEKKYYVIQTVSKLSQLQNKFFEVIGK